MTNKDILAIAMRQSAIDSGCDAADFQSSENKVVVSKPNAQARRYLELPFYCDFTSYGNNVVASALEEFSGIAGNYINRYEPVRCFETPNLNVLMELFKPYGVAVCFMAEYFLPDVTVMKPLECGYELRVLEQSDFADCYVPEWSNALCEDRKQLDVLGVGAYDGGKLIGLAACSADCDTMWQIGVDVLPEYRRQGIASCLTSTLAKEILARDIVPFYCCAWSNVKSARNAIKSGFRPAWVQLTMKSSEFVAKAT